MKLRLITADMDKRRAEWMRLCRQLVVALLRRRGLIRVDLCPTRYSAQDPTYRDNLRRLSRLNSRIRALSDALDRQESGSPEIGARALVDTRPVSTSLRNTLCLMLAARVDTDVRTHADIISEVVSMSAESPLEALDLRREFEVCTGRIRPCVRVVRCSPQIDMWRVAMRESAIARMLHNDLSGELSGLELVCTTDSNDKFTE